MGYYMYLQETTAKFKVKNSDKILKAIKKYLRYQEKKNNGFTTYSKEFWEIKDVKKMFENLGWILNRERNAYRINECLSEKMSDEYEIFKAISPYMEEGFIHMQGEDGLHWKWCFKGGKFKEMQARIMWDDDFHIDI